MLFFWYFVSSKNIVTVSQYLLLFSFLCVFADKFIIEFSISPSRKYVSFLICNGNNACEVSRSVMLSQFAVSLVFYSAKVKAIRVLGLGLVSWIGYGDLDNVTTLVKWSFLSYSRMALLLQVCSTISWLVK